MNPREKAEYLEYALIFIGCWGVLSTAVTAIAVSNIRAMWQQQNSRTWLEKRLEYILNRPRG